MTIKIYVVSHKKYTFPEDCGYKPLQVGKSTSAISVNCQYDSADDNISQLNPSFCELTAAYWIWKNAQEDIVGLVHYRRYFSSSKNDLQVNGKSIASSDELNALLKTVDILVCKPRNYFITSIKNHYVHAHHESDYVYLRDEISSQHPDYLDAFEHVMNGTKVSLYNMFVCKKTIIDNYFAWLFPVLFALETKIDYQQYSPYQKRVFGFMAERLFNVWLYHHRDNIKIKYLPVVNLDGENLLLKGIGLIKRHFWGKK